MMGKKLTKLAKTNCIKILLELLTWFTTTNCIKILLELLTCFPKSQEKGSVAKPNFEQKEKPSSMNRTKVKPEPTRGTTDRIAIGSLDSLNENGPAAKKALIQPNNSSKSEVSSTVGDVLIEDHSTIVSSSTVVVNFEHTTSKDGNGQLPDLSDKGCYTQPLCLSDKKENRPSSLEDYNTNRVFSGDRDVRESSGESSTERKKRMWNKRTRSLEGTKESVTIRRKKLNRSSATSRLSESPDDSSSASNIILSTAKRKLPNSRSSSFSKPCSSSSENNVSASTKDRLILKARRSNDSSGVFSVDSSPKSAPEALHSSTPKTPSSNKSLSRSENKPCTSFNSTKFSSLKTETVTSKSSCESSSKAIAPNILQRISKSPSVSPSGSTLSAYIESHLPGSALETLGYYTTTPYVKSAPEMTPRPTTLLLSRCASEKPSTPLFRNAHKNESPSLVTSRLKPEKDVREEWGTRISLPRHFATPPGRRVALLKNVESPRGQPVDTLRRTDPGQNDLRHKLNARGIAAKRLQLLRCKLIEKQKQDVNQNDKVENRGVSTSGESITNRMLAPMQWQYLGLADTTGTSPPPTWSASDGMTSVDSIECRGNSISFKSTPKTSGITGAPPMNPAAIRLEKLKKKLNSSTNTNAQRIDSLGLSSLLEENKLDNFPSPPVSNSAEFGENSLFTQFATPQEAGLETENGIPFEEAMDCDPVEYPGSPMEEDMMVDDVRNFRAERQEDGESLHYEERLICADLANNTQVVPTYNQYQWQIVLDTNIFLSSLKYIKELRDIKFEGLGYPVLVIPWYVMQELDRLKEPSNRRPRVAQMARLAVQYLRINFKTKHPRVVGETVVDANPQAKYNADDGILRCCLRLAKTNRVILLSNDTSLCNKATVNGVEALSLEEMRQKSNSALKAYDEMESSVNALLNTTNQNASLQNTDGTEATKAEHILCRLKLCLRSFLRHVLEHEMEKAYNESWLCVVKVKPPWDLQDMFKCLDDHWIAVFGLVLSNSAKQHIEVLRKFFVSNIKDTNYGYSLAEIGELIQTSLNLCLELPSREYGTLVSDCIQSLDRLIFFCTDAKEFDWKWANGDDKLQGVQECLNNIFQDIRTYCALMCDAVDIKHNMDYTKPDEVPTLKQLEDNMPSYYPLVQKMIKNLDSVLSVLTIELSPRNIVIQELYGTLMNYLWSQDIADPEDMISLECITQMFLMPSTRKKMETYRAEFNELFLLLQEGLYLIWEKREDIQLQQV